MSRRMMFDIYMYIYIYIIQAKYSKTKIQTRF